MRRRHHASRLHRGRRDPCAEPGPLTSPTMSPGRSPCSTPWCRAGVKHIVFSSTAAVYGNPHTSPILEAFPIQAVNPYGESKVMVETLLAAGSTRSISSPASACALLQCFAGADPEAALGERARTRDTPDSLSSCARVQTGRPVTVFGDDYAASGRQLHPRLHPSSTISAQAHILAVEYLLKGGASDRSNVGTGAGSSVWR